MARQLEITGRSQMRLPEQRAQMVPREQLAGLELQVQMRSPAEFLALFRHSTARQRSRLQLLFSQLAEMLGLGQVLLQFQNLMLGLLREQPNTL